MQALSLCLLPMFSGQAAQASPCAAVTVDAVFCAASDEWREIDLNIENAITFERDSAAFTDEVTLIVLEDPGLTAATERGREIYIASELHQFAKRFGTSKSLKSKNNHEQFGFPALTMVFEARTTRHSKLETISVSMTDRHFVMITTIQKAAVDADFAGFDSNLHGDLVSGLRFQPVGEPAQ